MTNLKIALFNSRFNLLFRRHVAVKKNAQIPSTLSQSSKITKIIAKYTISKFGYLLTKHNVRNFAFVVKFRFAEI